MNYHINNVAHDKHAKFKTFKFGCGYQILALVMKLSYIVFTLSKREYASSFGRFSVVSILTLNV